MAAEQPCSQKAGVPTGLPQKSMSRIRRWLLKWLSMLQLEFCRLTAGVPQVEVSGEDEARLAGSEPRAQLYSLM